MLCELNITNIALIKSLRIEFTRGLNALTGETGAGKSIVVDCVNLALGHRGGRELVRTGQEKGSVKALFDIGDNAACAEFLNEMQIDYDDGYVEVSRDLLANGKGICRINGNVVPLGNLKAFTSMLVDLHGQQEHQRLLSPENHVLYLDSFGGSEIELLKQKMKEAYTEFASVRQSLNRLNEDEKNLSQRFDILSMQVKEINSAKLREGEEEELERKSKLFENSQKLSDNIRIAYERVYLGGKSLSAQESLKRASDALKGIADLDEQYASLSAQLEEILYSVKDVGYELQSIFEDLSFDPAEADRVQDRLETLKKLKRKYGPEVSDVIAYGKKCASELEKLKNLDDSRAELEMQYEKAKEALKTAAEKLSAKRKEVAVKLEKAIKQQLADLGMGRTEFEVEFRPASGIGENGSEEIEFMISPNPGEPLRPLATIASGGEVSRFMLAIKVILAENDGIDTMIFDEIDTGISGRMAQTVGEKMAMLGKDKQVICVTHLAQIAALADTQFLVEKSVQDGRTNSSVQKLSDEGRVEELVRLVGGAETDASGESHARSMLQAAAERKQNLRQ